MASGSFRHRQSQQHGANGHDREEAEGEELRRRQWTPASQDPAIVTHKPGVKARAAPPGYRMAPKSNWTRPRLSPPFLTATS